MSNYKLEKFGTVMLPQIEAVSDIGSVARLSLLELAGGGYYDQNGTQQTEQEQTTITHQARLVGTTETDLYTQFRALQALRGVSDKLYRYFPDGSREWCQARMLGVKGQTDPRRRYNLQIEISFAMISRIWNGSQRGPDWQFDNMLSGGPECYFDTTLMFDASTGVTFALDANLIQPYVTNGGNAAVTNPIIRVTAGSVDITYWSFELTLDDGTYMELDYSGTIASGKTLVIDCGAMSVVNDGVDDYSHLTLGSGPPHSYDGWLKLQAGVNMFNIYTTGHSATASITFEFSDGWV
jgi:hypothetical protein